MRVRQRILIRGVCLALTLGFLAAGQCLLVAGESFAATGPGRTDEDDGALYEEYDEATDVYKRQVMRTDDCRRESFFLKNEM